MKKIVHLGACLLLVFVASYAQQMTDIYATKDPVFNQEPQASENLSTQEQDADTNRSAQVEALLQRITLRRELKAGHITEEEFLRQKASLDEIIHEPIAYSDDNPPEVSSHMAEDPDLQARVNAFQKKLILRGRMEMRAITQDEYDREAAPLDDIIQYPGILTNRVIPEQVMSPDLREQVDAFKQYITLRREYQRGQISAEEYGRQFKIFDEIMNRSVRWTIIE